MRASVFTVPGNSSVVYPLDQYVTPVEVTIQPIDAPGATQITVQGTSLPLDQIDVLNIWSNYIADGGNQFITNGLNTYSGKVVTALRFVNSGSASIRLSLAEGGIIS